MFAEFATAFALSFLPAGAVADDPIDITPPRAGARFGTVTIPSIDLRFPLVSGTGHAKLERGVGHLRSTYMPGMGGTIALFGHRVTPTRWLPHGPFYDIDRLRRGDRITVRVGYGTYTYRVRRHRIVGAYDWRRFRPRLDGEQLLLAACHPKGSARLRYVVIARAS